MCEEVLPAEDKPTADHEGASLVHQPTRRPTVAKAVAAHHVDNVEHLAGGISAHGAYPTSRAPMWMWFQWLPPT